MIACFAMLLKITLLIAVLAKRLLLIIVILLIWGRIVWCVLRDTISRRTKSALKSLILLRKIFPIAKNTLKTAVCCARKAFLLRQSNVKNLI